MKRILFSLFLLTLCFARPVSAQYFGRNKPVYQQQDFKVVETPHFKIYQYLNNPDKTQELSQAAELWYAMHQAVLRDTFSERNPMIVYNDHAGFQQTNVIQGDINVGTGGVTEALRNRVIFPVAATNQQTHHVLGHELVHAFQYHMILQGDSTNIQNFANLPLWMVEGLAEYMSVGRIDAQTALWMRDAALNDELPRIKDLDGYKYFPYRWGQSFWAYITGVYGDETIQPLFMNTAKHGLKTAVKMTLGTTVDSLSEAWRGTLKNYYGQWVTPGKKEKLPGKTLLDDDNAGEMNVGPVLSPNGKYVVFLSEKNLFTTDLLMADAKSGKILKKIASTSTDGHLDQLNGIESSGTWSPDSKRFAFDAYEKGRSVLIIKDVERNKTLEKIFIPGVPSFSNAAWSPDGKTIVVTGLVNGQTDLFLYHLKTRKVQRLTNDRAAEILPAWSPDGTQIAYSTDALSLQRGRTNGAWAMNLALLDVATGSSTPIDVFTGADNMNPQFDKAGNLYFLSNRDGFRNLYKYDVTTKKVFQLTDLQTGITGVTPYAPAISISENRDRILYTYYNKRTYVIHQAREEDFTPKEVDVYAVDMAPAALPPFKPGKRDIINTNLRLMDENMKAMASLPISGEQKYKPNFTLEYAGGSTGAGVNTGNTSFGTTAGLAGGVDLLFGDMLDNNQLYAGLALNGEIVDAAGQVSYINNKKRIGWGFNFSHIPYSSLEYNTLQYVERTVNGVPQTFLEEAIGINRLFVDRVGGLVFYPFSVTKRVELGGALEFYNSRTTRYSTFYDANGFARFAERTKDPKQPGLALQNLSAALVGDNSYFGLTAPLQGWRYRLGVEQYFGDFKFSTLLLDGRRYFYVKPVTFALRGMAYGRFGGNSSDLYPLFVGQANFMHGYTRSVLTEDAPELVDQVFGSKIAVGNFEVRLPFTGPRRLSLIKSGFLITDLNLFFDAGLSFFDKTDFQKEDPNPLDGKDHVVRKPVYSTGVSLRVNVFNYLVLEPYFALPLSVPAENRRWTFGFNLVPGW
ncbi:MAG: hypothetical protein LCH81_09695 [Bacteroidetes bacterium]|nr:hypothetical protein [Bacteroidota bacterium]